MPGMRNTPDGKPPRKDWGEWVIIEEHTLESFAVLEARRNADLITRNQPIPEHADSDILKSSIEEDIALGETVTDASGIGSEHDQPESGNPDTPDNLNITNDIDPDTHKESPEHGNDDDDDDDDRSTANPQWRLSPGDGSNGHP